MSINQGRSELLIEDQIVMVKAMNFRKEETL
jgi:hypothetical protein